MTRLVNDSAEKCLGGETQKPKLRRYFFEDEYSNANPGKPL